MNPARTLAERFRVQRTDRIRVDGDEVLSLLELEVRDPAGFEVLIESTRHDVGQRLVARSAGRVMRVDGHDKWFEQIELDAGYASSIDFEMRPVAPATLQIWNSWSIDGVEHAWTGNAGLIVEELEAPPTARRRLRLWCSDGLGDADFSDLIAVVTIGPAREPSPDRPE